MTNNYNTLIFTITIHTQFMALIFEILLENLLEKVISQNQWPCPCGWIRLLLCTYTCQSDCISKK